MNLVLIYYLHKGRALPLRFKDQVVRTFAPKALVPQQYVDELLQKQMTIGGCCGKPSKLVNLFATQEQMDSGERVWIE